MRVADYAASDRSESRLERRVLCPADLRGFSAAGGTTNDCPHPAHLTR